MNVLGVVGAVAVMFIAACVFATVVDVGKRGIRWLRGDKSAWEVEE